MWAWSLWAELWWAQHGHGLWWAWHLSVLTPPSSRSLNELRVLLLEANRHSPGPERDLGREVHKAEWRIKEQKLKDDIRGLREKLTGLVCDGEAPGKGVSGPRKHVGDLESPRDTHLDQGPWQ